MASAIMRFSPVFLALVATTGCHAKDPVIVHDLARVLRLSQKFYVAQRCGDLPDDNRVTWRRDSFLDDGAANGIDLEGGYFDAGDHMKFGFPLAYTMTMLAWGMVQYESGFRSTGEYDYGLDNLKWGTDYLLKTHTGDNELWAQCGDPYVDHDFWGRPEEFPFTPRPSYKLDPQNPGTDLAALTAAAMAAASMVFRSSDPSYADRLVDHAMSLYEFADTHRGIYSNSIESAGEFYSSSGYEDELVWAAIWIYKATSESFYLDEAVNYYDAFDMENDWSGFLDWDEKRPGVNLLMYEVTGDALYGNKIREMCDYYLNEAPRTPGGMLFFGEWASAPNAASAAFTLLVADDLGVGPSGGDYVELAVKQVEYILGDNPLGMSYVIGYGDNYPLRPHHSASSCPTVEECGGCECGWEAFEMPDPNPQVLEGALVGGPGANDDWEDDRTDYVKNEVALDYNAGFQGAIAGLIAKGINRI